MTAWMIFRGHGWRPTLEMASTTIVLGIVLVGLAWLGILPKNSLFELLTRFACPIMIIPMLFRMDMYTGHHASHSGHKAEGAELAEQASCH
jgi:hypothetical protein